MNERLGRGLGALIPESADNEKVSAGLSTLPVSSIVPNRYQPRKVFDPQKLAELAESIRSNGIIQPIIVTKTANSGYELIAGERRLEAAKLAGMESVPVIIRSVGRREQLQLAIIENVQRENLNPIEEALAYSMLIEDFELTHADVAKAMGKDRATISNTLRLLNLAEELQEKVSGGELSAGHARAVLSLEPEYQIEFAQFIIKYKLTVRQAEEKAKTWSESRNNPAPKPAKTSLIRSIEQELSQIFHVKTKIKDNKGKGKITLEYSSPEELQKLKEKLLSIR